ncbi:BTAD domain-containing putative transcriptional regulator [Nonomuraea sp. NPDC050404]|uniref:AfsR/SARP family transcriptional regulator n=1 Tax=Nonomuraea sp. NPDC050404 TaxID=3155783 RepID=UPI00340D906A
MAMILRMFSGSGAGMSGLQYSVLGPLGAYLGERAVPLGARRQQAVLAILLLHLNQAVSIARLLSCVWGEQPPEGGHRVIACYVHRLRKALTAMTGEAGTALIQSVPGAYQLSVGENALDLTEFDRLTATGRREYAAGDERRAVATLRQALSLWRGDPLSGLPGPFIALQQVRLREYRTEVLVDCLTAELDCGRHAAVVADLTGLAASYPLHERIAGLLMVALYRCGRRGDALAAFQRTRYELKQQGAGIEPSRHLRELHHRILQSDPLLTRPRREAATPCTLPRRISRFVGRSVELDWLARSPEGVTVIHGPTGAGKTTLAIYAAHRSREHYPDGQHFVDLRAGAGVPVETATFRAAAHLLRVCGHGTAADPLSAWRTAGRGKRLLILLDDCASAGQVVKLLPPGDSALVLVTSRVSLHDLPGARRLRLAGMSGEEARMLLAGTRTDLPGDELDIIAKECDFLPSALSRYRHLLAHRGSWPLTEPRPGKR